ncbi:MAG: hypothetical protein RIB03_10200 [Henriciella sp.]|uniref:hypothetical protein n=1 Tax=Henriciella sp. TaxID=1968823 RepID=UPI002612EA56|nr:hypothetical protein [Henriciella sp.]
MKRVLILIALTLLPATSLAEESVCRSVLTRWEDGGHEFRTKISEEAVNGCKRIWHSVDDSREVEGVDCDCDLVLDGMERAFSPPPSANQAERLLQTCRAPASRNTQTARPAATQTSASSAERPRIILR